MSILGLSHVEIIGEIISYSQKSRPYAQGRLFENLSKYILILANAHELNQELEQHYKVNV